MAKSLKKGTKPQAVMLSYRMQIAYIVLVGLLLLGGVSGLVNLLFINGLPLTFWLTQMASGFFPLVLVAIAYGFSRGFHNKVNRLFIATVLATMAYATLTALSTLSWLLGVRIFSGDVARNGWYGPVLIQTTPLVIVLLGYIGFLIYWNKKES